MYFTTPISGLQAGYQIGHDILNKQASEVRVCGFRADCLRLKCHGFRPVLAGSQQGMKEPAQHSDRGVIADGDGGSNWM